MKKTPYLLLASITVASTAAIAADSVTAVGTVSGLNEVRWWSLDTGAKTLDPNNNNIYGEDGYVWFGTDGTAVGGTSDVESGFIAPTMANGTDNYMSLPSYVSGMGLVAPNQINAGPDGAEATRNNPGSSGDVMTVGSLAFSSNPGAGGFTNLLGFSLDAGQYRVGFTTNFVTPTVGQEIGFNLYSAATNSVASTSITSSEPSTVFFDIDISSTTAFSLAVLERDGDSLLEGTLAGITFDTIPEPGTYALIGGMLSLTVVMLRRRR
tara:strand:- start:334 stop:1131 length:798 start_codon:yes stop_codon:yes gene_type:complete